MQLTAEFLLEPKARQATAKGAGTLFDSAAPQQPAKENRFANVFAEQQRRAEPAPARQTPDRAARNDEPQRRSEPAADGHKARPAEGRREQVKDKDNNQVRDKSQKSDSTSVQKAKSAPEAESEQLPANGWAELNPLLQQVIQANQVDVELNPELAGQVDDFLLEGVDALPQEIFASLMAGQQIQAGAQEQTKPDFRQLGGQLQQLAMSASKEGEPQELKTDTETDLELELELELDPEALPEETAGLSTALLPRGREEPRQGAALAGAEIKTGEAGQVRNEALLRTESVQQSAASRQIPGQPLNMQQPGWSKELTDKVMWMSARNLKSAEIKLNPAELGRLEVRVQLQNEQTQVTFVSAHAGVRDSLDNQMFRLREMLAQQGMEDVDVNVSDQSGQEQEQRELHQMQASATSSSAETEVVEAVTELPQHNSGTDGSLSYYV